MTNEALEIQKYVDQITVAPVDEGGMLGLSVLGSLLATFIFAWIVAYIIGMIAQYKEDKTWMLPDKRYWLNLCRSSSIFGKAFAGFAAPVSYVERSDAYYYTPTQDEFDEALLVVHQLMTDGGWTIADYQKRSKDCEDYAMKMSVEIRNYIATTWSDTVGEKGVAVGIVGYTRDVDGLGHVIVVAWIGDDVKYYEPYPGEKYLQEKSMSQTELDSIYMSIM